MSIPVQIDHTERALDRLLSQWENSPKLKGLIKSFSEEVDELEDCLFQMLNERGIYTAVGAQLDIIGALFDIGREGRTDTQYRNAILEATGIDGQDGTTEVFMQSLRTHTGSDFVDFWEHLSGDVHALLGDGFYYNSWADLQNNVPAGVSLRIYVDDQFDSFQGAELITTTADLQTNLEEDIQVTPDGVSLFDLQVEFGDIGGEFDELSILPEIVDTGGEPFFAELLFTFVFTESGNIVDDTGEFIIDNDNNTLIWIDYHF